MSVYFSIVIDIYHFLFVDINVYTKKQYKTRETKMRIYFEMYYWHLGMNITW